jgi:hypothetical protein
MPHEQARSFAIPQDSTNRNNDLPDLFRSDSSRSDPKPPGVAWGTQEESTMSRAQWWSVAAVFVTTFVTVVVVDNFMVGAEPRPIHEGINGPATGEFEPAVRGTQVQVNPPPSTSPPQREWTGAIPSYYGGTTGCSQTNATLIARAMWNVGANDAQVYRMLNIVSRESTCDSAAYNGNRRTGDDSWGFAQQNSLSGWFDPGQLLAGYDRFAFATDPALNARAVAAMYARCGFGPWNYGNYYCRRP